MTWTKQTSTHGRTRYGEKEGDSILPFPLSVYTDRIDRLQSELLARGLRGLLLFDPENMFWLTGYQTIGYFTFQAMWVGTTSRPVLVSRVVNRELARAHETIDEFEAVNDTADHVDVLASCLSRWVDAKTRVAVETHSRYLSVHDFARLKRATLVEWIDANDIIEQWRAVKTEAEIGRMRLAARAAESGLAAAIRAVAPGKTENDVAAAMFEANIAAGSEYLGHPPLVVTGPATALCFAMWRRREIRIGDVVLLEAAGCVDRYHSMVSRPVVVGTPTGEQRAAADALQAVLETAIDSIAPGRTAGEIDARCRKMVGRRGLAQYFLHRSAYGIGIGFPPNWSEGHIFAIRPGDPLVLQPNMTFHVIPTVFKESFGMCFSDSVRVTESGCELLTDFPRQLFTIGA